MQPATIVLIHSPLGTTADWDDAPAKLQAIGAQIVVPNVVADDRPPHAARFVAAVAQTVAAAAPAVPLLLVAMDIAGPLLPAVGFAQRAARRRVGGYVFVDAPLPRPGTPSHLDLLATENPSLAQQVHEHLHGEGSVWPPEAVRPRGHDFWTEPLPHPPDWPDAPCGYLSSGRWPASARLAASRTWTVRTYDADLADALIALIDDLPGR